ncbi:MAG: alpha/beta hydrolase [Rubrivivax sp.]|nr:alpha/beta hydrolase [Rubrivivax sp.]
MTVDRHLCRAGGLQWHYREAGAGHGGLPLVLLHPSPRSSAMYAPWMAVLGAHCRVLAVDTPGYGGTDALPALPSGMADYAGPLHALLQTVAGPRCVVYGSATGAQLGIALALSQPQAVAHLVLDNAAHFDDDERDRILAHYFPDLAPRADGSHLARAWQMCAQMAEFFPWFDADEAHRIAPSPAPAAAVHAAVVELLAAGPGYNSAYRAAFAHERAAHVQALRVPTTLLRWRGSILLRHMDRLLSFPLPANVAMLDTPAPPAERQAAMTAHLHTLTHPA